MIELIFEYLVYGINIPTLFLDSKHRTTQMLGTEKQM